LCELLVDKFIILYIADVISTTTSSSAQAINAYDFLLAIALVLSITQLIVAS